MKSEFRAGNRFFIDFEGSEGFLPPGEAHHAIRVLRKREGDEVRLIDGKGREFRGKIFEINWKKRTPLVRVKIEGLLREQKESPYEIIAIIPLLKGDRTEFLIEKGTELGVTSFFIYISEHTVVRVQEFRGERFLEKAISSLKQSGRLILPKIEFVGELKDWLSGLDDACEEMRIVAHRESSVIFRSFVEELFNSSIRRIYFAVGPEGDFSEEELTLLREKNFKPLSLGPYILRTETAFCVLCGIIASIKWHSTQGKQEVAV